MDEMQYKLTYKTRGESSPQGKPRVYFCCHPKDFGRFFESISDEILYQPGEQNCAVWYAKEVDAPRDAEFLDDLTQMQLFVMPVTTELLYTKNHAIDIEFPFAIEHHIPVLPLMQEGGLEEIFNQKCGDLQFLDKTKYDPTALPYEEKFKNYLSSILIGDELAEQIREAFDACVFLSYRKKDRKHARELMRLIHKNDFCRDIAIWYDEFLIPGEDFNDAIKEALDKSGLFVLAVTPNLVNEKNYVMTVEYPMAKEAGKPILPAEMTKTNRFRLKRKYKKIPRPIDAHDEKALSEALLTFVKNLAIKENDKDARHNFFIGLAYLTGIDVEVDHKRALSLITSAAEAGLIEAIDKLIQMYEEGEGVARNYEKAAVWRENQILYHMEEYCNFSSIKNMDRLIWLIIECGDAYRSQGKLLLARQKYEEAESWIESSGMAKKSPRILRNLSIAYRRLGTICYSEKDHEGARENYEKATAIFAQLAEITHTVEALHDLSTSYIHLGDICQSLGDLDHAKEHYERCKSIFELISEHVKEYASREDFLGDFSLCYEKLGDICRLLNDFEGAARYYEKSKSILKPLSDETDMIEYHRNLSVSYARLGTICLLQKDFSGATKYFEMAKNIGEQLLKKKWTVELRRDLSIDYNRLGDLCMEREDFDGAKEYYEKAWALRKQLFEDTGTIESRSDLSYSHRMLGKVCLHRDDTSGALEHYEKSKSIDEQLVNENDTMDMRYNLSCSYMGLGESCLFGGNLIGAKEYYEKAKDNSEQFIKEFDLKTIGSHLLEIYGRLGDICLFGQDFSGAMEFYMRFNAICEQLVKEAGTPDHYSALGESFIKLSMISQENNNTYMQRALEIFEMLCRTCPNVRRYQETLNAIRSDLN